MTQMDKAIPQIALVTRTRTINQGNQALSIAWRDYLAARYPGVKVRLFERAPQFLRRYTVSALAAERDPVAAFDRIAYTLLRKMPENPGADPSVCKVHLDLAQRQVVRFRGLRQALRLRSRMAALNVGSADYLNRLRHLTQSSLVVVNPAGEFHSSSTDTALLYLLETRCAQLAGCRTAVVNLSFEVMDPTVICLSNHVFSACDVVEFRDDESQERLAKHGGTHEAVVLPDGVILSAISPSNIRGGRGILIAVNGTQIEEIGFESSIRQLIARLANKEQVTLTSNEWATDQPFWNTHLRIKGVQCDGHGLDYNEYARFLAGFDVVVSSRLHTCVLGMLAGATVVPVECGTFKLTGFFNQIGMPSEPVRIGSEEWQGKLVSKIASVQANREARLMLQDEKIGAAVTRLRSGLDKAFSQDFFVDANNEPV